MNRFQKTTLLFVMLLCPLMLITSPDANAWYLDEPSKIAFTANRYGSSDIFIVDAGGENEARLTSDDAADENSPDLSPDGEEIVFSSNRDGDSEIYVMNIASRETTQLTDNEFSDRNPRFRPPDGEEIAFVSLADTTEQIYVMNVDGSNLHNLSDSLNRKYNDVGYSPDGSEIVVSASAEGHLNSDIWVMDADNGEILRRLTDTAMWEAWPTFSPDSKTIAFTRQMEGAQVKDTDLDIYIMDAEEGEEQEQRVTVDPAEDTYPEFSPDGSMVAFTSRRDGFSQIYAINPLDRSGLKNLSENVSAGSFPTWGRASKIVFSTERWGSHDIYIMDADGWGQTRLTSDTATDRSPDFSGDGKKIGFTRNIASGDTDIYDMNVDGSNLRARTGGEFKNGPYKNQQADLALDYRMFFVSNRDGYSSVYVSVPGDVHGPGRLEGPLTSTRTASEYEPVLSSSGEKIVYTSIEQDGFRDVWVMDDDGSNQINTSDNTTTHDAQPDFSPDDSRIAFTSWRDGNPQIYVMNFNGTGQRNLSNNDTSETNPVFSTDGSKIAFQSSRDGYDEIYIMNSSDGTNQYNVSNWGGADDVTPDWYGETLEALEAQPVGTGETPAGSDIATVTVTIPDPSVGITFADVTVSGFTTVTTSDTPVADPPSGFRFIGNQYEISTDASYTPPIIVTLIYDENLISGDENSLEMFHYTGSNWEKVTASVDTANKTVTGQVYSFSHFVLGEPVPHTGLNSSVLIALALAGIGLGGLMVWRRPRFNLI